MNAPRTAYQLLEDFENIGVLRSRIIIDAKAQNLLRRLAAAEQNVSVEDALPLPEDSLVRLRVMEKAIKLHRINAARSFREFRDSETSHYHYVIDAEAEEIRESFKAAGLATGSSFDIAIQNFTALRKENGVPNPAWLTSRGVLTAVP